MFTLVLFTLVAGTLANHQLHVHNRCGYEVWVGILGNPLPDGAAGASHTTTVTNHWSGRFWGRTHCSGNHCQTGNCGHGPQCSGAGGAPPATLAEITFDAGGSNNQDFYDISLVDGYNLPMSMQPINGYSGSPTSRYCARAGCNSDLNHSCPPESDGGGEVSLVIETDGGREGRGQVSLVVETDGGMEGRGQAEGRRDTDRAALK
ncbi:PR5K-like protein [Mya arenaria]|uniref:PR5K-like protein n=1 Tax=Mya arenaria TaxID=6604 RepID=A0ABY7EJZ2_MYAAR|nr:PR5K-like protein [Mya arenaria]